MVMVPEAVKQQWAELRQNPVIYGEIFWDLWEQDWLPYFDESMLLVKKNIGKDMSLSDSSIFYNLIKKLVFFIDFLRAKKEEIVLNRTVRDLYAHHVGNGLLKIFCFADFSDNDKRPILSENVDKILTELTDLRIFWNDLKALEKFYPFIRFYYFFHRYLKKGIVFMRKYLLVSLFLVFGLFLGINNVMAAGSGAFRDETVDAQTLSMGNAFAGEANTPAAVYYNPAGLNQLDSTTITLSDAIIAPRADFKNTAGDDFQMRNHEYDVPAFYAVVPIIKNKLTVGVGSGSYWGLGTDWNPDSALRYAATQNNLINTDSMITGAYQITNQWSFAVGVDNDYSKADENKKFPNSYDPSPIDGNQELKATDDAWGYRLATMFKINDQNQVGLMYRSPIVHHYSGNVYIDGIGPTYSALLFNGATSYETKVTEKLTLPQSVVLGYSFKPTTKWTINFDLEWMDWASIKNETYTFPNAPSSLSSFLNTGNPLVHDWTSSWSEGIGTEYKITNRFRVRAGFYHHGTVGPDDYFDPAMPDLQAFGVTEGFGYNLTKNLTIDVGYSAQMFRPRKVNTVLASGMANGTYREFINDGVVSLTYKF